MAILGNCACTGPGPGLGLALGQLLSSENRCAQAIGQAEASLLSGIECHLVAGKVHHVRGRGWQRQGIQEVVKGI